MGAARCFTPAHDPLRGHSHPASEVGGQPGTGLYTVVVTWQALAALTAPSYNCANGLYGNENMRRAVSTQFRIADLY